MCVLRGLICQLLIVLFSYNLVYASSKWGTAGKSGDAGFDSLGDLESEFVTISLSDDDFEVEQSENSNSHRTQLQQVASVPPVEDEPVVITQNPLVAAQTPQDILVFDWDDTLFATSWTLAKLGPVVSSKLFDPDMKHKLHVYFSSEEKAKLAKLEAEVLSLLTASLEKGEVNIVSNADKEWIIGIASLFYPKLEAILKAIHIVSAKKEFEKIYPMDLWKLYTFEMVLMGSCMGTDDEKFNVLSVGDAEYERHAVFSSLQWCLAAQRKSIKLMDRPNLDQLINQVVVVRENLNSVMNMSGRLDLAVSAFSKAEPEVAK